MIALVQSKRHSSVAGSRRSVISGKSGQTTAIVGFKTKQQEKLVKLEEKYAKVLARQEKLHNPFYFQELRAGFKQDERELEEAKKFHKQLKLDNQGIETEMTRIQRDL